MRSYHVDNLVLVVLLDLQLDGAVRAQVTSRCPSNGEPPQ
jgi:hypothetical protein